MEPTSPAIRVTVWGENVHEKERPAVAKIYPQGMHRAIADGLKESPGLEVRTATLDEPEHGLTEEILQRTDVLTWWGHGAHGQVEDKIVDRVQARVLQGMGLIVLHSGHYAKIFKRLLGTTCSLTWREAGEKERLWVCNPGHPIAQGIDRYFEIPNEEMYGEPFAIPNPDEVIFLSWFEGGEAFRSGCTWKRGKRQDLLFPARARNLSDLFPGGCSPGFAECRALGASRRTSVDRFLPERPDRKSRRKNRAEGRFAAPSGRSGL